MAESHVHHGTAPPSAAQLLAAISPGVFASSDSGTRYRGRLALAAAACALLPLAYAALIAGYVVGLTLYFIHVAAPLQAHPLAQLLAWAIPAVVGGAGLLLLLKPVLVPLGEPAASVRLDPASEPDFFAVVGALSRLVGVAPPAAVHVVSKAGAWLQFDHGWSGFRRGRKRLCVGLPLLVGLDTQQLIGVLAHELGHFRQDAGLRLAFIVHATNRWMRARVFEPDALDYRLQRWQSHGEHRVVVGVVGLCIGAIWLARLPLRGLLAIDRWAASGLGQQMEFDADLYEISLVGSTVFAETAARVRALELALHQTETSSVACVADGMPPLDLSLAVLSRLGHLDGADEVAAPLCGVHPVDLGRVQRARAMQAPGLFHDRRSARSLLRHFEMLSMRVTEAYYRDLRVRGLVASIDIPPENEPVIPNAPMQHSPLLQRFGAGMLNAEHLDLNVVDRSPWRDLSWQECLDRLASHHDAWDRASRSRRRRDDRLRTLAPMMVLLDRGVPFRMADGRLPDGAALRAEQLLLRSDQGEPVLYEVPALQARRLQCAILALPQASRPKAMALWQQMRQLQMLAGEHQLMAEISHAVMVLAWNQEMDLDQVEVAYELARGYRLRMTQWLEIAQTVVLEEAGVPLADFLLPRCPQLVEQGADDIGYVEALKPLHPAFRRIVNDSLERLVAMVEPLESTPGLVAGLSDNA